MSVLENDVLVGPVTPASGVTTISLDFDGTGWDASWLEVYKSVSETPLVLGSDYTVTDAGTVSAVVTLSVPANGADTYSVYLATPLERSSDMQLRGEFKSEPFNAEADRIWQRLQYQNTLLGRAVSIGRTSALPSILREISNGQVIALSQDGLSFTGVDASFGVEAISAWYDERGITQAENAALNDDGTVVSLGGVLYVVDSTATGAASDTSDLGVDGLVLVGTGAISATVGPGGDFPTITKALKHLSAQRRLYNGQVATATISLLSGFTMAEQVIVDHGVDLSWITITSVDAEVPIARSSISQQTTGLGDGFASIGAYRAAFMGGGMARMPGLGCKMVMDSSGMLLDQSGIFLTRGAEMEVLSGCGIDDTVANGAHLMYGAKLVAPLSEWDGNGINTGGDAKGAIRADWQATVSAQQAVVTNQLGSGIIILGASTASVRDAHIEVCGEDGLEVGGCSLVHARGLYVSGCGRHALFAGEGCSVRLIQSTLIDSVNGIWAELGARVNSATGTVITGHTNYGVHATSGSQVILTSPTISAGINPVHSDGAEIQLLGGSATGGTKDLFVDNGGVIRVTGTVNTSSGGTLAHNIADANVSAFGTPTSEGSMIYGRGGRSRSRGSASIASGNTSVTVTHSIDSNFGLLPEEISVIPVDVDAAALSWYVTSVTATTFDIKCVTAPTGQADFKWNAQKILL